MTISAVVCGLHTQATGPCQREGHDGGRHFTALQSSREIETVQRSRDRFLTTHTGSLPRPDDLIRMMYAKEEAVPVDPAALAARVTAAVAGGGKKQDEAGPRLVTHS